MAEAIVTKFCTQVGHIQC